MKQECVIWQRAKELGKEHDLDVEREMVRCSTFNMCDGSLCIYLSETGDTGPQQLEKFRTRQEKTDEILVAKARRDLARLTKGKLGRA